MKLTRIICKVSEWLQDYWKWLLVGILVWVFFGIVTTIRELSKIEVKDLRFRKNEAELLIDQDSAVVEELRKLRNDEVLIIKVHNKYETEIWRIPADDLQGLADSLYNNR